MENIFFEPAVRQNSIIHKMDSRIKVVAIFSFVALTSTMNYLPFLAAAMAFILILAGVSRLPAAYLAKRLVWIIPFGGILVLIFPFITAGVPVFQIKAGFISLAASDEGIRRACMLFFRVMTAVTALSILTATTGFRELMTAFKELRIPGIMVSLMEFTVRYIFVLLDEVQRMRTARKARGFEGGGSLLNRHAVKTIGQLIGVLFVRSWERGERVYNAMLARGFSGQLGEASGEVPCARDICVGAGILVFILSLRLAEFGGQIWQISLK